jgi:hypothetical protein
MRLSLRCGLQRTHLIPTVPSVNAVTHRQTYTAKLRGNGVAGARASTPVLVRVPARGQQTCQRRHTSRNVCNPAHNIVIGNAEQPS